MATGKIVYLVSSREHDGAEPEAILTTPELAERMAGDLDSGEVLPLPLLDYVPERVTAWQLLLRHTPRSGWMLVGDDGIELSLWDYEVPKMAPGIFPETFGELVQIRVLHRERATARDTALAMLATLRTGSGDGTRE